MFFDRDQLKEYGEFADAHGLDPQNFIIPAPTIIEKTARGERAYDLFSRLMEDRIVMIYGVINQAAAAVVTGQLLFLQKENKNLDVSIYIYSPGGDVMAGLAIYDAMQFVAPEVSTVCVGQAASMGAVLLAGGQSGKRYSLPNSRVMIHQPWGGVGGTASDIERQAEEVLFMKRRINEILAQHTGQAYDKVEHDTDRDYFFSPQEAKEYGLIDDVIQSLKKKNEREQQQQEQKGDS